MNISTKKNSGFTLVELAIVLVIIGLIVGGVLVGQDLIRAATIRSVVTDIEKYNAAATTFRGKYNGLPGDLLSTRAVDFGLNATNGTDASRNGTAGKGDGNGIIEACAAGAVGYGCETGLFWTDLTAAGLIPARLAAYTSTATTPATLSLGVPKTRLRDTALVSVFNNAGRNYLALAAGTITGAVAAGTADPITFIAGSATAGVTPLEARNVDEKLDDGGALTGTVIAIAAGTAPSTPYVAVATGANLCVLTGGSYMVDTDAHANNVACAISLRSSF